MAICAERVAFMKGVSEEQRIRNAKDGKYKLKKGQSGKIKNNGIPLVKGRYSL